MSRLSKHNRGGNSGAQYSQGGQSPNQVAPIIAAAGKMLLPMLKKKGAEMLVNKGGEMVANKMNKSNDETASTPTPTLGGAGGAKTPVEPGKADESYLSGGLTKKGSPVHQKKDDFNDFSVPDYQAKSLQTTNQFKDFSNNLVSNFGKGATALPERQKITFDKDPTTNNEKPTEEVNKPASKDYSGGIEQNKVTSNKYAGGYGEFANNQRGGGMDGRPMETGIGKAFERTFGREAVNLIRERSRMRKEARNEIRRGDISGITGSGYDQTIGEGKNWYKLKKTQSRLESKKQKKIDKFRRKGGLAELGGKQINITNDQGEVMGTGQAFTRDIKEGQSDGHNTYMRKGVTRSTDMNPTGIAGELYSPDKVKKPDQKQTNNPSSKSDKNNADLSKLNTFTPFDKDRMDANAAKPKDMLSPDYKFGDNFFNSMKNKSNQKLSLSKDEPTSSSKSSGKTDPSVKLDYEFGQSLKKDPKKLTFADLEKNKKSSSSSSGSSSSGSSSSGGSSSSSSNKPSGPQVEKMTSKAANIDSKQLINKHYRDSHAKLRVPSKLPEIKSNDFKPVKDKSTDKDAKVIDKLKTKKGGKLKRVAKRNPQLAAEVLGDKDPNKLKEARKNVPKIKKKQLKASTRDKQRAYDEKYGVK